MTGSEQCRCLAGEKEFLFQPHSFLEPLGGEAIEVTADGVVGKVHNKFASCVHNILPTCLEAESYMHALATVTRMTPILTCTYYQYDRAADSRAH